MHTEPPNVPVKFRFEISSDYRENRKKISGDAFLSQHVERSSHNSLSRRSVAIILVELIRGEQQYDRRPRFAIAWVYTLQKRW